MNHFSYRAGVLHAEDVPLPAIAAAVGTPFYCYSTATLVRHYRVFRDALAGLDVLICYAMKANSNQSVIRTFIKEGAGVDVVSEGELRRALAAGASPDKIVFAGVGKTAREIAFALDTGILCFNVESEPELERISDDRGSEGTRPRRSRSASTRTSMRRTHAKITTGKAENKFGIPYERARAVYARAAALPGHPGERRRHAYRQPDHRPRPLSTRPMAASPISSATSAPRATPSTTSMPAAASAFPIGSTIRRRPSPPPMARSSAAASAISAPASCSSRDACSSATPASSSTEVVYVKHGAAKTFVIVDAGDERPDSPDAVRGPSRHPSGRAKPTRRRADRRRCGRRHLRDRRLSGARPRPCRPLDSGDLVAIMTAGAYGAVQGSTYNSPALAPEILVNGDRVGGGPPAPDLRGPDRHGPNRALAWPDVSLSKS